MEKTIESIETIAKEAKQASRVLATCSTEIKNQALNKMASGIESSSVEIIAANDLDMEAGRKNGLTSAMLDRLKIDEKGIASMAEGIRQISRLPDPVGEISQITRRPNGLEVGKMQVPIGVIGIIYESRPNVTADAAALCLKSGNGVILRGGSEAFNSNQIIASVLSEAAAGEGIPNGAIGFVPVTDRDAVLALLKMDKYIDLIIPRGGYELIRFVSENSVIPVIKHDAGLCHVYVDSAADIDMATAITLNAKVQRPSVCNALETLLVHDKVAARFLPDVVKKLIEAGVEVRGCEKTVAIAPGVKPATEDDWSAEYLDLILAIKVVENYDEAVGHIDTYGSQHTDVIVTGSYKTARKFLAEVDSSAVMVNASTRFNDGGQFGLGAEMGISTQKLHCRGPMGLVELTSKKYIVMGDGHIRE